MPLGYFPQRRVIKLNEQNNEMKRRFTEVLREANIPEKDIRGLVYELFSVVIEVEDRP